MDDEIRLTVTLLIAPLVLVYTCVYIDEQLNVISYISV